MKSGNFEQIEDGIPITLHYRRVDKSQVASLNFSCCDCGLVHNIAITPMATRMKMYFWRDNRRTANRRRRKVVG